jgi:hypothetical protein
LALVETVAFLLQTAPLVQILYLALLLPQAVATVVIPAAAHQVETAEMAVPAVAVRAFRLRQADQVLVVLATRQALRRRKVITAAAFQPMDCHTRVVAAAGQLLLDRLAARATALVVAVTEPLPAFLAHL